MKGRLLVAKTTCLVSPHWTRPYVHLQTRRRERYYRRDRIRNGRDTWICIALRTCYIKR